MGCEGHMAKGTSRQSTWCGRRSAAADAAAGAGRWSPPTTIGSSCSPMPCEHWLDWSEGNIYSTAPERVAVARMLAIATVLGAVVRGDNGEI